jgi:dihydroxyacetone kinase
LHKRVNQQGRSQRWRGDRKSTEFLEKNAEDHEHKKQAEERRKVNQAARTEREREAAANRKKELEERQKKMVEQTRESLSNMSEGDLEHLFRRRHYKSADDTGVWDCNYSNISRTVQSVSSLIETQLVSRIG